MYGKRDFEKWVEIQKGKGNLLYENQNKGLIAVALAGLQLPSLYSESDPLFNNSIPNSTENVNKPTGRELWHLPEENYGRRHRNWKQCVE